MRKKSIPGGYEFIRPSGFEDFQSPFRDSRVITLEKESPKKSAHEIRKEEEVKVQCCSTAPA
ncbi:hypothetical protein [Oceanidesulfovibrio marinus]|uniref:Uncharacterized protein n=1 Tax=Oceanidesulfovibrio marinus TaxID=370038 RepID=A0ABX6NIK6_9BACT|nr:hypothetical protein [Oceanidesulfovibrio marinus]QJT09984.1 hypothetical protein E8L03_14040 [Oceanidesulfovibrio marinus]